ncbi:MAG: 30S ribosomal protein S6, partial [Deltaproteobacteria bacterium]|nr:30S ribosomal protein S6 [Deltaproteobacteria bacterium]
IVIVHPSLSQEDRQPFLEKMTSLVSEPEGLLLKLDEWGQKKLAYEIKKQTRGYYVLLEYCGDGALVKELERNLRLDDRALKYMTVCIDKDADVDRLKAELEAAVQQEETAGADHQQSAAADAVQPAEGEAAEKPEAASEENQAEDSAPEGDGKDMDTEEPEDGSVQIV